MVSPLAELWRIELSNIPLVLHDLLNAVEHASVVVLARDGDLALDLSVRVVKGEVSGVARFEQILHSRLDHIQRVHDQDLRHTGDSASGELVDEGKRLRVRHIGGCAGMLRVGLRSRSRLE